MENAATFGIGLLTWTLIEYAIHAWLSHTFKTFATPMHDGHHRDPHAVFAIGAWIPIALIWLLGVLLFGWVPGIFFYSGLVAGFAVYEAVHYRLHFVAPSGNVEAYLRSRHLVHHNRTPHASFGVTSALWDLVFGTEVSGPAMVNNIRRVGNLPPLRGPSNLGKLFRYRLFKG
jgi:dihydroceramide fatty acyl 2-hydroxylase